MKESTLNKKLKSYSALAGSIIAVGTTSADAQVVYTDVNPDSLITSNNFYELDLDNDGIKDFILGQQAGTYYGYAYNIIYANPLLALNSVDTTASGGTAKAANAGYSVDATCLWADSNAVATTYAGLLALAVPALPTYNMGNFIGVTDKFLPLKFDVEGNIYYGWVRLTTPTDASTFTVKDYAYKNAPTLPSITGLMTDVSIAEHGQNNGINIFSFENTITVRLDKNIPLEGNIIIRNMLGQTIQTVAVSGNEMIIPVKEVKAGAYTVTIAQSTGGYTKRVILK